MIPGKDRPFVFEDLTIGMAWTFHRTMRAEDMEATMALTGDQNGYHVDPAFAKAAGFGKIIVPGLLPSSMFTKIGGNLNLLAREMVFRYLMPVYLGDCLEARLEVSALNPDRRIAVFDGHIINQDGAVVLTCRLEGHLPQSEWGHPEKPEPYFP